MPFRKGEVLTAIFLCNVTLNSIWGGQKRWLRDEDPLPALVEVLGMLLTSPPGSSVLPIAPLSGSPMPLVSSGSCIHIYIPTHRHTYIHRIQSKSWKISLGSLTTQTLLGAEETHESCWVPSCLSMNNSPVRLESHVVFPARSHPQPQVLLDFVARSRTSVNKRTNWMSQLAVCQPLIHSTNTEVLLRKQCGQTGGSLAEPSPQGGSQMLREQMLHKYLPHKAE